MPSFTTIFLIALLAGAGFAVAHYFGTQIAAKMHHLLTWIAGGVHPAVAKVVAPVPVTAAFPADDRDQTNVLLPWDGAAAFAAYVPGDPNGAGSPSLYNLNWLRTLDDTAFRAFLVAAIGPAAGDPDGGTQGLGPFTNLSRKQWTWLAMVDSYTQRLATLR